MRPPMQFGIQMPMVPVLTNITSQRRCYCCDDRVGRGDEERCAALQLYDTLLEDLRDRDAIIERELASEDGASLAELHRSARWFMYRTFVAAQFGYLGAGVRVRIPECVVAAIRSRYRAPGCDCAVKDIGACRAHGYTGFREASGSVGDE